MLRNTLLSMSQNQSMRRFVTSNRTARTLARRFVAGEALDEALAATRALNQQGLHVSLDHLGENVSDEREAQAATQGYQEILDHIHDANADANISLKLTALGLDIARDLCEQNLTAILTHAEPLQLFVRVDMEGSAYTDRTLDITLRMHERFEHVGTVIQSCLYRSKKDVEQLILQGVRVRLVKGAYQESKDVAFPVKRDVDRNYVRLMTLLLQRGNYPALATHDEEIIHAACKYARENGISPRSFEFQMLYGIRRDLQEKLVREGYNVRVYVPYGSQWYPYMMRRLAERPANLMFVASNALRR